MLTDPETAAIPQCLDYDPMMSFAEVVWHAQIELDLIAEGQEAAGCYTKRDVRKIQRFVAANLASLHSMKGGAH